MAGPLERELRLKVDATAFKSSDNNRQRFFVVFFNINIPAFVVNDAEQRRDALNRTRDLLVDDFGVRETVFFQITATYILKNAETNDERQWKGSFQTKLNNPSLLSEFQQFRNDTFVEIANGIISNAEAKLLQNGRNSKWTFERLQSIIVNAQCLVFESHSVLQKRSLVRRQKRFRVTFDLP